MKLHDSHSVRLLASCEAALLHLRMQREWGLRGALLRGGAALCTLVTLLGMRGIADAAGHAATHSGAQQGGTPLAAGEQDGSLNVNNAGQRYVTMKAATLHNPIATETVLLVTFEIADGWHLYWPGYNDTGFAPKFTLTSDQPGVTFGAPTWPSPVRHAAEGEIVDHIYEGRLTVAVPVHRPEGTSASVTLNIGCKYLVCKESCLPGAANVSITVPAGQSVEGPSVRADLAKHNSKLPIPLDSSAPVAVGYTDGSVTVRPAGKALLTTLRYFPWATCEPANLMGQCEVMGSIDRPPLLKAEVKPDPESGLVSGIIEVTYFPDGNPEPGTKPTIRSYWFELPSSEPLERPKKSSVQGK
jgi:DsbC/DsbD-like thiol-disulfide interchange protein